MTAEINWQTKVFQELNIDQLYDMLKLRVDVFVVEQTCYYPDLDELDRAQNVLHHFAYIDNKLAAYCRILPPNLVYTNQSAIGRVVIGEDFRGQKLGEQLMKSALAEVSKLWPSAICHISAQQHLHDFYQNLGFSQVSEMYLEDGIPHIGMEWSLSQ
jgi:ElaA protein